MCNERYVGSLDDFLARLEHYVNLDTPSGGKEALDAQGAQLREEFLAAGAQVLTHERPGGNLLECRIGTGPKQILLLGHMDTVFPTGTVAKHPYTRSGDILTGPGVLDMKSGVLMILEIFRHFAPQMPPEWSLVALLNCDEEIGSLQSSPRILELARESEACLCMEPSKPGYCTVARKGLTTFTITTSGVAAHSGVNYHLGHSAIQALSRIISNLYTLRDDEKAISINVGGISGGTGKGNVVAAEAGLIAEVRFYQPELAKPLLEAIERFAADTGDPMVTSKLTVLAQRPPMQQTERSRKLYEKARACAEQNGLVMEPRTHGGGSDGSFAASAGIPVIDGMGAEGEFSHTMEEYVKADTIIQRLQTCIDLISQLMCE
jgi:glutamate carboxypeptidase